MDDLIAEFALIREGDKDQAVTIEQRVCFVCELLQREIAVLVAVGLPSLVDAPDLALSVLA